MDIIFNVFCWFTQVLRFYGPLLWRLLNDIQYWSMTVVWINSILIMIWYEWHIKVKWMTCRWKISREMYGPSSVPWMTCQTLWSCSRSMPPHCLILCKSYEGGGGATDRQRAMWEQMRIEREKEDNKLYKKNLKVTETNICGINIYNVDWWLNY